MKILVTGGTGSVGSKFVEMALQYYKDILEKLVIFSRDEMKQYEMSLRYPKDLYPQIQFIIGDIRDYDRVKQACSDIEIIVHCAAMKHVSIAEENPYECIMTNIIGAQNLINAAIHNNVDVVVAMSTDKAAAPGNLYGATKMCSDKLFVSANNLPSNRTTRFSVVRYGNVFGSRGSVVPFFLKQKKEGKLWITDKKMTRFSITAEDGVEMLFKAIKYSWGGEIFIPKLKAYSIMDLVDAMDPENKCERIIVGMRNGEKLIEEMITETDALHTYDCKDYFVINPVAPRWDKENWIRSFNAKKVKEGFSYNSTFAERLKVEELKEKIKKYESNKESN